MIADDELKKIFKTCNVIAVVGCSRDPNKDAHKVPQYLKEHGYDIIPVNPHADQIFGERARHSITEVGDADLVSVFRPSKDCLEVVKEALSIHPQVIWMQVGIENKEAAKLAEEKGITVIMDRCIMTEHRRLMK